MADEERLPYHWPHPLPDDITPLTDREVGRLVTTLARSPGPVEAETVLRLLARYLQLWAAADRMLEVTGTTLAGRPWPHDLALAEGALHLALDSHDDL